MVNQFGDSRWPLIVLLGLLASGCASTNAMDEDECRVADWRAIGYEDGASGRSASHLGVRRQACADHGITPKLAAYRQGRMEGLREYCTSATGYSLGRRGQHLSASCPSELQADFRDAYKQGLREYCTPATGYSLGRRGHQLGTSCPTELQADFRDAYKAGREVHQAATLVRSTDSKLQRKKRELDLVRSSLTSNTSMLIVPSTTTERRIELLVEIQALSSRKSSIEDDISKLSVDLERHREELAALKDSSVY